MKNKKPAITKLPVPSKVQAKHLQEIAKIKPGSTLAKNGFQEYATNRVNQQYKKERSEVVASRKVTGGRLALTEKELSQGVVVPDLGDEFGFPDLLSGVVDVLDFPGRLVRGHIAGVVDAAATILNGDSSLEDWAAVAFAPFFGAGYINKEGREVFTDNLHGQELLKIAVDEVGGKGTWESLPGVVKFTAGLAVDIGTDPLTYIFPMKLAFAPAQVAANMLAKASLTSAGKAILEVGAGRLAATYGGRVAAGVLESRLGIRALELGANDLRAGLRVIAEQRVASLARVSQERATLEALTVAGGVNRAKPANVADEALRLGDDVDEAVRMIGDEFRRPGKELAELGSKSKPLQGAMDDAALRTEDAIKVWDNPKSTVEDIEGVLTETLAHAGVVDMTAEVLHRWRPTALSDLEIDLLKTMPGMEPAYGGLALRIPFTNIATPPIIKGSVYNKILNNSTSALRLKVRDSLEQGLLKNVYRKVGRNDLGILEKAGRGLESVEAFEVNNAGKIARWRAEAAKRTTMKRLDPILKKYKGKEVELMAALEGGKHSLDPADIAVIRETLDELRKKLVSAGVEIGEIKDYMPRVLSPEGYEFLRANPKTRNLGQLVDNFIHEQKLVKGSEVFGVTLKGENPAELRAEIDAAFKAFYSTDKSLYNMSPRDLLSHYIEDATRLAELNLAQQRSFRFATRAQEGVARTAANAERTQNLARTTRRVVRFQKRLEALFEERARLKAALNDFLEGRTSEGRVFAGNNAGEIEVLGSVELRNLANKHNEIADEYERMLELFNVTDPVVVKSVKDLAKRLRDLGDDDLEPILARYTDEELALFQDEVRSTYLQAKDLDPTEVAEDVNNYVAIVDFISTKLGMDLHEVRFAVDEAIRPGDFLNSERLLVNEGLALAWNKNASAEELSEGFIDAMLEGFHDTEAIFKIGKNGKPEFNTAHYGTGNEFETAANWYKNQIENMGVFLKGDEEKGIIGFFAEQGIEHLETQQMLTRRLADLLGVTSINSNPKSNAESAFAAFRFIWEERASYQDLGARLRQLKVIGEDGTETFPITSQDLWLAFGKEARADSKDAVEGIYYTGFLKDRKISRLINKTKKGASKAAQAAKTEKEAIGEFGRILRAEIRSGANWDEWVKAPSSKFIEQAKQKAEALGLTGTEVDKFVGVMADYGRMFFNLTASGSFKYDKVMGKLQGVALGDFTVFTGTADNFAGDLALTQAAMNIPTLTPGMGQKEIENFNAWADNLQKNSPEILKSLGGRESLKGRLLQTRSAKIHAFAQALYDENAPIAVIDIWMQRILGLSAGGTDAFKMNRVMDLVLSRMNPVKVMREGKIVEEAMNIHYLQAALWTAAKNRNTAFKTSLAKFVEKTGEQDAALAFLTLDLDHSFFNAAGKLSDKGRAELRAVMEESSKFKEEDIVRVLDSITKSTKKGPNKLSVGIAKETPIRTMTLGRGESVTYIATEKIIGTPTQKEDFIEHLLKIKDASLKSDNPTEATTKAIRGTRTNWTLSKAEVDAGEFNLAALQEKHEATLKQLVAGVVVGQTLRKANAGRGTAAVVQYLRGADLDTLLHEYAHVFRPYLSDADQAVIQRAYQQVGNWTIETEERFAEDFVFYLRTRKAPSKQLQGPFKRIRQRLHDIIEEAKNALNVRSLRGNKKLEPGVEDVFNRLLSDNSVLGSGPVSELARTNLDTMTAGYLRSVGMDPKYVYFPRETEYAIDSDFGEALAKAYDTVVDTVDPEIEKIYFMEGGFVSQLDDQYTYLSEKLGIVFDFKKRPASGAHYQTPEEMTEAIDNKSFLVDSHAGDLEGVSNQDKINGMTLLGRELPAEHPARAQGATTYNDIYRAVHDVFGHARLGNSTTREGEDIAYMYHAQMFSPEARKALFLETRAQNMTQNFQLNPETGRPWGRGVAASETVKRFPDQKASFRNEAGEDVLSPFVEMLGGRQVGDQFLDPTHEDVREGLKILDDLGKAANPRAERSDLAKQAVDQGHARVPDQATTRAARPRTDDPVVGAILDSLDNTSGFTLDLTGNRQVPTQGFLVPRSSETTVVIPKSALEADPDATVAAVEGFVKDPIIREQLVTGRSGVNRSSDPVVVEDEANKVLRQELDRLENEAAGPRVVEGGQEVKETARQKAKRNKAAAELKALKKRIEDKNVQVRSETLRQQELSKGVQNASSLKSGEMIRGKGDGFVSGGYDEAGQQTWVAITRHYDTAEDAAAAAIKNGVGWIIDARTSKAVALPGGSIFGRTVEESAAETEVITAAVAVSAKSTDAQQEEVIRGIQARASQRADEMDAEAKVSATEARATKAAKKDLREKINRERYNADRHWTKAQQKTEDTLTRKLNNNKRLIDEIGLQLDTSVADLRLAAFAFKMDKETRQVVIDSVSEGLRKAVEIGGRDYALLPSVADAYIATAKAMETTNPNNFFRAFDRVTNWLKAYQIATPGFTFRNVMGGVFMNAVAAIDVRSYKNYLMARAVWVKTLAVGDQAGWDAWASTHSTLAANFKTMTEWVSHGISHDTYTTGSRLIGLGASGAIPRAARWFNGSAEEFLRGSLMLDSLARGIDPEAAMQRVMMFHFDYGDFASGFEQQWMKRIIPFYTFFRHNMPLQLEMILKKPSTYSHWYAINRNLNELTPEESVVPGYFGELQGVRLPLKVGDSRAYWLPDLPIKDLAKFKDPYGEMMSMVNPLIKVPLEYAQDKMFWKGIPITDKQTDLPNGFSWAGGILAPLGITNRNTKTGGWNISEKNLYVLDSFAPILGRIRRGMPSEERYKSRQFATLLNMMFGLGVRVNTPYEQKSELLRRKFS